MHNLPSYQHTPSFDRSSSVPNEASTRSGLSWRRLIVLGCGTGLLVATGHWIVPSSSMSTWTDKNVPSSSSIDLLGKSKESVEAKSSILAREEHKQEKARSKKEKKQAKMTKKEEKHREKEAAKEAKHAQKVEAKEAKKEKKAAEKKAREDAKAAKNATKPTHHHYPFSLFKTLMSLDSKIDGDVYFPWNWTVFDEVKHVWNQNARSPLVVIEVDSEKDIQATVPLLAELDADYSFPFRIRSGGHNYAGYSSVAGGAILSLSRLKSTSISHMDEDSGTAIATLGPAATVQDVLDNILVPYGYSGVLGLCGGVAESGFALNGGFGYLTRNYGLGLDSVLGLRVVLADGKAVTASPTENPDLFFALRGAGGGNFGVVTEIKYRMHKSQDTQLMGTITMAYEDLGEFFHILGKKDKEIPGEVLVFFETNEGPELLVSWFGSDDVSLEVGKKYLEEDLSAMMPFNVTVEVERTSWAESTRAAGNLEGNLVQAWTGFLFADNNTLPIWNDIMSQVLSHIQASDYLIPDIEQWGGAIGSVAAGDTAFGHREALFNVGVLLMVPKTLANATQVYQAEVDKVNAFWPSLAEYMDGVYMNYQMESLNATEYPRQYWGANLERLVSLKNKYDPKNVFNGPQSLPLSV